MWCTAANSVRMVGRRAKDELDWLFGGGLSPAELHPPEFISDRLLKMTLELCGRASDVTLFVVVHAPTDTQQVGGRNTFWTALGRGL